MLKHTWLALALAASGCMTSPSNGQTTSTVVGKQFNFGGKVSQPNMRIDIQILNEPTLDPTVETNWTRLVTTYSKSTPDAGAPWNDQHDAYSWSTSATPVPTNPSTLQAKRWPAGGLARFRAVHVNADGDKLPLATFDDVNFGCLIDETNTGVEWDNAGAKCEGMGGRTAVYVHTANLPDPAGGFLTDKGVGNAALTFLYYQKIGAPSSLGNFRQRYGFNSDPGAVVHARYYNDGDLGLGREMNCKSFVSLSGTGVACYVRNYSDAPNKVANFDENVVDVLEQTVSGQGAFATVAMVYEPGVQTKFIVYNADGNLQYQAPLDKSQDNISIPQNCLACHGIDSKFEEQNLAITGNAEFLPFDPYAFKYSNSAPWRLVDQQNALRKLNQLVKLTDPPAATIQLIDGMYKPKLITDPTAIASDDYVPAGWHNPNDDDFDGRSLYRGLVKPFCRTCHVSSNSPTLDFSTSSDFAAYAPTIRNDVCGNKRMPHAERVQKKLWQSGARAYLTTGVPPASYPDPLQACTP